MNLAELIISKLGIDPAELQTAVTAALTDARTVKNEVLAAKQGFMEIVTHFDARFDALNARLDKIEASNVPAEKPAKAKANGAVHPTGEGSADQ